MSLVSPSPGDALSGLSAAAPYLPIIRMSKALPPRTSQHDKPNGGRAALIIIDMINCLDFPGAKRLLPRAMTAARKIAQLRTWINSRGWPVVFINDNFGQWHSEKNLLVEQARRDRPKLIDLIAPAESDYFIIKPQFSGFYSTNLPVLLPRLGIRNLILTGLATDICVLFTAADAHMRDYEIWVPRDTVAAESEERGQWALDIMAQTMGAETAPSSALSPERWLAKS